MFIVHYQDNGIYTTTLIVQHDNELIMPGDGAFTLQCDFKSKDGRYSEKSVQLKFILSMSSY